MKQKYEIPKKKEKKRKLNQLRILITKEWNEQKREHQMFYLSALSLVVYSF